MGEMVIGLYVFVLATLAGREVITKVPPTLHTPLMSGANAISGIAIRSRRAAWRRSSVSWPS
jgi:NAD(P) transhydrogenase subunit alpha